MERVTGIRVRDRRARYHDVLGCWPRHPVHLALLLDFLGGVEKCRTFVRGIGEGVMYHGAPPLATARSRDAQPV